MLSRAVHIDTSDVNVKELADAVLKVICCRAGII